jgi:4-hydroxyacetophenone monooxygenase
MVISEELRRASDREIEDAVPYADKMVLRGVLYHVTGDERVAATAVEPARRGLVVAKVVADPGEGELLQARAAEFLKRYRDGGADGAALDQYEKRLKRSLDLVAGEEIAERDVEYWSEELALTPWARSLEWPQQPAPGKLRDFHVLLIGLGLNGLNAAIQLKKAGIPFTAVEKNPDVGGTWFENHYPGCRVDTPSRAYSLICGAEFDPPYSFSPQRENLKYARWMVDKHGILPHIEFETEVLSLSWDESAKLWEARSEGRGGSRIWRVNAVISAVGFLSRPSEPKLEGAENFKGRSFHTARWPDEVDVAGKRVAVIGSGASGYQTFPEIARVAEHTFLFQRVPNWVFDIEGYLNPLAPQVNWLERNLPYYRNFLRFRSKWMYGPNVLGPIFNRDPNINDPIRAQRIEFMRRKFANRPDLFDKMLPKYPPFASRPVLVDNKYSVYDALTQNNTTLVTDGIARVTERGILDNKGNEHTVDFIAMATGFKANEFLWPMDVRGREGRRVEHLWKKDGPRAYIGTMLPGFPNFFMIYGPNTNPLGGAGVLTVHEMVSRFIASCLAHLIINDKRSLEVTVEAYDRYNAELDKAEELKIYARSGLSNYYTNEFGRSPGNCPFDGRKLWEWLRDPTGGYVKRAPGVSINADSRVHPYFGQDLIVK